MEGLDEEELERFLVWREELGVVVEFWNRLIKSLLFNPEIRRK